MTAPSRTADEIIADWHAGRADHDPYDEIGGLVAEVGRLRTENERLTAERDKAREECGHAKAMRQGVSEELSRFVRLKIDADAELERTEGDLGVAIREAAAAREALKAVDALLSGAERIAAAIGRDYTGEGVEAWVRGEDLRPVVDAALDQRLTQ